MDVLTNMVTRASAVDVLVFHYSRHGTQVPDQGGNETVDRLDEALCPRDFS